MPTFIPDRLKTPGDFPSIDANDNQIRGFGFFADNTARSGLAEEFRCHGYLAYMKDTDQFKQYNNTAVDDTAWENDSNWVLLEGQQTDTYWSEDSDGTGIYYSNQVIVGASTYSGDEKFYVNGDANVNGSLAATSVATTSVYSAAQVHINIDSTGGDLNSSSFKVNSGTGSTTSFAVEPFIPSPAITFGNANVDFDYPFYSSSSYINMLFGGSSADGFKFSDALGTSGAYSTIHLENDSSYFDIADGSRAIKLSPQQYKISTSVEADANATHAVEMLMPDSATGDWTFNHLGNKNFVFNTNTSGEDKLITKFHDAGEGVVSIGTANYYNEYNGIQFPSPNSSLQPRLFIVNDGTSDVGVRVQSGNTDLGSETARTQPRYFTDMRDDGFYISRDTAGPAYNDNTAEWDDTANPDAVIGMKRYGNGNSLQLFARNDLYFFSNSTSSFQVIGDSYASQRELKVFSPDGTQAFTLRVPDDDYGNGDISLVADNIGAFLIAYGTENRVTSGSQILSSLVRGADFKVTSIGNPASNVNPSLQVYSLSGNANNTGYWWGLDGFAYDTEAEMLAAGTTIDTSKLADQLAIYVPKHGSGKVGIGTTSPTDRLHVVGSTFAEGVLKTAYGLQSSGANDDMSIYNTKDSTGYIRLITTYGGAQREGLRVLNDGTTQVNHNLKFNSGSGSSNYIAVSRPVFDIRPADYGAAERIPQFYLGDGTFDDRHFTLAGSGSHFESTLTLDATDYYGFRSPRSSGWIQANPAKVLSVSVTDNTSGDVDTQFWSTEGGTTTNYMTLLSSGRLSLGSTGSSFSLPVSDGSAGYVLKTDGSGDVTWSADSGFETAEDMKSASLSAGDTVETQGRLSYGDGGAMLYEIKDSSESLTDDGGSVITLNNGNFAQAIISGPVSPVAWGVKINDSSESVATANTLALNKMFKYVGDSISSADDATVAVVFPGELIYINGEVKLPIGSSTNGTLRQGIFFINFNGSKIIGLDTGSPYTMFARRKTDLDDAQYGSPQSSPGTEYMNHRIHMENGSIQGPNRDEGMTLVRIDCTYNSFVEKMQFSNADYGLKMHFCLNARVQNNLYNNLNYGLWLDIGDWAGASNSNSASNVTQVFQDRHYCTYPSKRAITVRSSSGVKLSDIIVEGGETEYGIVCDANYSTTVVDFTIDGLHLEVSDSGSNEGITKKGIWIKDKNGGESTIQRVYCQYKYDKFNIDRALNFSNTTSATEGTYTLYQDSGDITTDGSGSGLVMSVVVDSSGSISSFDLAGDPDRTWGFAAGDTITIPAGNLGGSSTEASFELRRGDVKDYGIIQNKVPTYDGEGSGSYGRMHIGEVYPIGSYISVDGMWPNIGGGTGFASGSTFGNSNSSLYEAVRKYARHVIAYDNPYWVSGNTKGGFDSTTQTTSSPTNPVDGFYVLKQSDGDITTDGSGTGIVLRFYVKDGIIDYWDVGGQAYAGTGSGESNTVSTGKSTATGFAEGDKLYVSANKLGSGSGSFDISITDGEKLDSGSPKFKFLRTPYYGYYNTIDSRGASINTGLKLSGGNVTLEHTNRNANIYLNYNSLFARYNNVFSIVKRSGYTIDTDGTDTNIADFQSAGDLYMYTAGKGVIVRTPDDSKSYRISVDNSGNVTTTAV